MIQETTITTFTIYPILALFAVYGAGWWIMKRNSFAWENGRMGEVWKKGQKDPSIEWIPGSFTRFAGQWEMIWLGSVIFASIAAILGGVLTHNPYAPYIFGAFGFVAGFTGWTDLWVRKAPIEMSHLGLYALLPPLVFGLLNPSFVTSRMPALSFGNLDNLLVFGFFSLIPFLFFALFVIVGGIGLADIRALWMAAFAFSWWLGGEEMILLTLVSIFVQLLAQIPANIFKWGELKDAPVPGLRRLVNRIYQKITNSERKLWADKSRAIPWLPAIGATFTYGSLLMLLNFPKGLI